MRDLCCRQSRRHGGLNPPNKAPSPSNWNTKHVNQWSFCQFLTVKPPPEQTQSPPRRNVKPPYWNLSGEGSGCHPRKCLAVDLMTYTWTLINSNSNHLFYETNKHNPFSGPGPPREIFSEQNQLWAPKLQNYFEITKIDANLMGIKLQHDVLVYWTYETLC